MTTADAERIQSHEEKMRWPTAQAIGAAGVSLVTAQLLLNRVLPCTPMMDIGFDLVTAYGNLLKRAQIKATQMDENVKTSSTSFSVKRNKAGHVRNGTYMPTPARGYEIDEVDVFIFANIKHGHFYVIPAEEIDLKRYKLSLSPDSKWANAWWVLKTP
jgi:hypothetical protein